MEEKLHIIGEGGAYSTLVYLIKQGIRPRNYIEHPDSLEDLIPYLGKEDTIVLLLRGLTDYTMQEVYSIIDKMEEYKGKLKETIIMTNIPLGNVKVPYYLYEGDLIYGSVVYYDERGIVYELDRKGEPIIDEKRVLFWKRGTKGDQEKQKAGNIIMKKMIDKEADHKPMVHQRKQRDKQVKRPEEDYVKHIKYIDIYKENKK